MEERNLLLREAILNASLDVPFDEKPTSKTFYLPPSYNRALKADAPLIVGGIGAGKTFLAAALQDERLRAHMSEEYKINARWLQNLDDVTVGFGSERADTHPSAEEMDRLVEEYGAYNVWLAVILRWLARRDGLAIPTESWDHTIKWLRSDPVEASNVVTRYRVWHGLIVFDGLDRATKDWRRMEDIVDGLLKAVSHFGFSSTRSKLHAKVFLREDVADQILPKLRDKYAAILATQEYLDWRVCDLHAMLWHRLINAPGKYGNFVYNYCPGFKRGDDAWRLTDLMQKDYSLKDNFILLTGPIRIGRYGSPYSWVVNTLADSHGQTSPRSFLTVIRQAAAHTQEHYPDYEEALHLESLKRGIQKASEVRVQEVYKSVPWAVELLSALRGMSVPARTIDVDRLWCDRFFSGHQSFDTIFRRFDSLPPPTIKYGWSGVLMDLVRLGLVDIKLEEAKMDMPEIYRVGFGLGRRGGVKPRPQETQQAEKQTDDKHTLSKNCRPRVR